MHLIGFRLFSRLLISLAHGSSEEATRAQPSAKQLIKVHNSWQPQVPKLETSASLGLFQAACTFPYLTNKPHFNLGNLGVTLLLTTAVPKLRHLSARASHTSDLIFGPCPASLPPVAAFCCSPRLLTLPSPAGCGAREGGIRGGPPAKACACAAPSSRSRQPDPPPTKQQGGQ